MSQRIYSHLMFEGDAEEAMNLYLSAFDDSELIAIEHYPDDHDTVAGKVITARFRILTQEFVIIDSPTPHNFSFTPSMSVFIEFDNEGDLLGVMNVLRDGGEDLMPLDNYGFSEKFIWFKDKFGVSWQLNLN